MTRILAMLIFATACTGTPSGATCPTDNPPTYDGFAKPFMAEFCTGCHSATATNRYGAPGDMDFDTEAELALHATDIDVESAKGPSATNTAMPDMSGPVHAAPSADERALLGQYLACSTVK
jgi:uncharacterized membrane protein